MEATLIEKVKQELEMLESIYSEDKVIHQEAIESTANPDEVECVFKHQPNTGFDMAKIAVIVYAKFMFKNSVRKSTFYSIDVLVPI